MSEFLPEITITGEQIKAARSMLRMGQRDFAEMCHVSVGVLRRMERTVGPVSNDPAILKAVKHALENNGIELISAGYYEGYGGPGIRITSETELTENVMKLEEVEETGLEKRLGETDKLVS